jgi:hypothetical protein
MFFFLPVFPLEGREFFFVCVESYGELQFCSYPECEKCENKIIQLGKMTETNDEP